MVGFAVNLEHAILRGCRYFEDYLPGPKRTVFHTKKGLSWRNAWGVLRYSANNAFLSFVHAQQVYDQVRLAPLAAQLNSWHLTWHPGISGALLSRGNIGVCPCVCYKEYLSKHHAAEAAFVWFKQSGQRTRIVHVGLLCHCCYWVLEHVEISECKLGG